jgi:excisionase family DNA binding protein
MSRILTVEQAADKLQMSSKIVREYLRVGKLPGRKIGRAWRVLESDLEAYVGGYSQRPPQGERVSALGLCADIPGFGTEEFLRRKRDEAELEEAKLRRAHEAGS